MNVPCRWKRDSRGLIIYHRRDDEDYSKPVLEFVAIERRDTKQWALPGVRETDRMPSKDVGMLNREWWILAKVSVRR